MKDLLLGLLVGGIVGLWVGVNLGKQQSPFSNPFEIMEAQAKSVEAPLPRTYIPPETSSQ